MKFFVAAIFVTLATADAGLLTSALYPAPLAYSPNLIAQPYAAYPAATPVASAYVGAGASEDTVIAGPSGTISTSKNVAGPAISTRYLPQTYLAPAYAARTYGAPVLASRYASAIPYAYTHYGGLYL